MTRLTIAQNPGEEFAIRGHNTIAASKENGIIFRTMSPRCTCCLSLQASPSKSSHLTWLWKWISRIGSNG